MRRIIVICIFAALFLCACSTDTQPDNSTTGVCVTEDAPEVTTEPELEEVFMHYTKETKISEVTGDPAFGDYGRLIFPVDDWYYSGETLGDLSLTWYSHIDPDKTVEICNYFKNHADAGDAIFYDIYSDQEKKADQEKEDTGLFFFKGEPGAKFAICNAGGGFSYVGAILSVSSVGIMRKLDSSKGFAWVFSWRRS